MEISNRIGIPPMCTYSVETNDGVAGDFHLAHYLTMAMGLPGFIIQEATAVAPEGRISDCDLGIYNKQQQKALKRVVDSVHHYHPNVKMGIQIGHSGRKATMTEMTPVAPSAIPFQNGDVIPYELKTEEVDALVRKFADAANAAQEIGYDFVEIHGAHGYLINQFLSLLTNKREDAYGKDRFLFVEKVVKACRSVLQIPLFIRLSVEEYAEGALHLEDYKEIVRKLEVLGVDFFDVSTGGLAPANIPLAPGYQVVYATAIKEQVNVPVSCVGLIDNYDQVSEIISQKKADIVLLGRKYLRDPFCLLKWKKSIGKLNPKELPVYLYRGILG